MVQAQKKSRSTELRFDEKTGRWCAKLGRKTTSGGKTDGHLFRFTPDKKESERRKLRIQALWDRLVEKASQNAEVLWSDADLMVAKAMAKGETQIVLTRRPVQGPLGTGREAPDQYARYVHRLAGMYPEMTFVPEDLECYRKGVQGQEESVEYQIGEIRRKASEVHSLPSDSNILEEKASATVAEALAAYETHVLKTMLVVPEPEEGLEGKRPSDTARAYIKDIERIREHNAEQLDWPISRLTLAGCDAMLQVWRDRPPKKSRKKGGISPGPMAVKTCQEHGKRLMAFFRWMSKSDQFDWSKPTDFDELKLRIKKTGREKAAKLTSLQVHPYTLDQLKILNEYAEPFERFLLLCGLNLGFKRMECATLRVDEIQLRKMHDHAMHISFGFSEADSYVRRLRTKTEVFGEWLLWPHTVQAMEWVLERRKKQTKIVKGDGAGMNIPYRNDSLVLLNENGHSFTKPTKSGNPNHQLTNMWNRLLGRIEKDHPEFPKLPHETLRDTSANWIREEFDGETSEIFLAHGAPLGSASLIECYTNRPWGKLFAALRWLEEKLAPVFEATPDEPFYQKRKLGGGGLTLNQKKQIVALSKEGKSPTEIAQKVKCSVMSVYRHRDKQGK